MSTVQEHIFKVGMTCEGCSGAVKKVLSKVKDTEIENIDINLKEQKVKVKTSLPQNEIFEILKKTGKTVEYLQST